MRHIPHMHAYGAKSSETRGVYAYIYVGSHPALKIVSFHVTKRWDMSVDEEVYCQEKARSLFSLKSDSRHSTRHCSKHLGCIHPPLLNIELDSIVVDELHLMLRVGGVLDSPHRRAQAASAEDTARENEHFDASQHLSQSGCLVEGKYKTHTRF